MHYLKYFTYSRNGGTSASPLIGKYCGTTIPKQITSHANKFYIFFKSDLSRSGPGFRITWSSAATGKKTNSIYLNQSSMADLVSTY